MRHTAIAPIVAGLLLAVGACSSDEQPQSGQLSAEPKGNTSLSIDIQRDSASVEQSDGDSSTSISVGDADKGKKN